MLRLVQRRDATIRAGRPGTTARTTRGGDRGPRHPRVRPAGHGRIRVALSSGRHPRRAVRPRPARHVGRRRRRRRSRSGESRSASASGSARIPTPASPPGRTRRAPTARRSRCRPASSRPCCRSRVMADNAATVLVNDVQFGQQPQQDLDRQLRDALDVHDVRRAGSGVHCGTNTLTIKVFDTNGVTGLDFSASVSYQVARDVSGRVADRAGDDADRRDVALARNPPGRQPRDPAGIADAERRRGRRSASHRIATARISVAPHLRAPHLRAPDLRAPDLRRTGSPPR